MEAATSRPETGRRMSALVWNGDRLEEQGMPEPEIKNPHEVKVSIKLSGICGTDLAVVAGKEPGEAGIIRGHEAVGIVSEVGEAVRSLAPGDRVVVDPNQSCGLCRFCRSGKVHLCIGEDKAGMPIAGLNRHGTFAPSFVTEERFLHRLKPEVSWEAAVLTEPLACVLHHFREAGIGEGESVLILGSGPMGLLCQFAARRLGCFTVSTELRQGRLAAARRYSDCALTPEELTAERVRELLGDRGFDTVIDTVGTQMATAERWVDRGGTIVPMAINGAYRYPLSPTMYAQQAIRLIGAGEYLNTFGEALRLVEEAPELAGLVNRRCALGEAPAAIAELLDGTASPDGTEAIKTVFAFS
ncbi:zinc-dependent alcohol dehydrogenase [Paenibacillus glufosinatiresistens]|uniref:zinc-dependent alcohol dehydrogenase n=1 Tax=Paenibacillus glufosinatiresistens TaxID=3070657 RepID=UPI00286E54C9|nr:alcohol dehydrogenase catalytic domain-containing protein [Paenibacillus sp. YX.27]